MRGSSARRPRTRPDDDPSDWMDVPATVVCAHCGQGDCPGCGPDERTLGSGVIAIVPWERPGTGRLARLYQTAYASTRDAEGFFGGLPDGPVGPALRFAVLAELLAVGSVVLVVVPAMLLGFEGLRASFVARESTRAAVLAGALVATLGFAALLVAAHAVHTTAMAAIARKEGSPVTRTRALRFGLYACGWDLCSSPAGFVGAWTSEGTVRALALLGASLTAPGRASEAGLRDLLRVRGPAARRARRWAIAVAMAVAVPGAFALVAALGLLAIFA